MTDTDRPSRDRRRTLLAAAVAGMALALPAVAQANWPDGPLRIIVPFDPGGTSDNIPRAMLPALERILGTSVTIENISGGGGTIGVTRVANTRPDGRTFGFTPTAPLAIAPHMRALTYDPLADIQPVAKVAESFGAMAVRTDFPPQSLEEIIAFGRENPGAITFGSAGVGSITHLYVEIFANAAGIEVTHVPFQGSAEAMNNVMGGHIDGQFDAVVLRQAQAGAVRPVAMLNQVRWDGLPDVPTMSELGFDGFDGIASWFGFIAPAGMPAEAVEGMSAAVAEALEDPEVRERLAGLGVIPTYLNAADFQAQIQSNNAGFGELLGGLGLAR